MFSNFHPEMGLLHIWQHINWHGFLLYETSCSYFSLGNATAFGSCCHQLQFLSCLNQKALILSFVLYMLVYGTSFITVSCLFQFFTSFQDKVIICRMSPVLLSLPSLPPSPFFFPRFRLFFFIFREHSCDSFISHPGYPCGKTMIATSGCFVLLLSMPVFYRTQSFVCHLTFQVIPRRLLCCFSSIFCYRKCL